MNYLLSETDLQDYGDTSTCVIHEDTSSCYFNDIMSSIDATFITYLSPPEDPNSLPQILEITTLN